MNNFYCYEVFGLLSEDIKDFCNENKITFSSDERLCYFTGNKQSLNKLHNEFFNEYEFNLKEVR